MGAAQNYDACTLQELYDLSVLRLEWWKSLCQKRRADAIQSTQAEAYRQWTGASDSATVAEDNLKVRFILYDKGLVPKDLFRTELLEGLARLDVLLSAHA